VAIDPDALRDYYASLTDDALLAVDRNDLTDAARELYDREVAARDLPAEHEDAPLLVEDSESEIDPANEPEGPDWLEEALTATAFSMHPSAAEDAAAALDTLRAAGIPCQVVEMEIEEEYAPGHREYQVMVPNGFSLQATSVLDKEIYNPRMEIEWRTHLESLTDDQFRALSPDALCAGFLDRAERLRKVYQEEVARRRKQSRAAESGGS
jgi:hypothetical protein